MENSEGTETRKPKGSLYKKYKAARPNALLSAYELLSYASFIAIYHCGFIGAFYSILNIAAAHFITGRLYIIGIFIIGFVDFYVVGTPILTVTRETAYPLSILLAFNSLGILGIVAALIEFIKTKLNKVKH